MIKKELNINFYKENLNFPLSDGDCCSYSYRPSIKVILNTLKNYVGKKTNVIINLKDFHKIFISPLIRFCELEGIDYTQILEIEVIQNGMTFQIIVNKGTDKDVQLLKLN